MPAHFFADENKERGLLLAAAMVEQSDVNHLRSVIGDLRPRSRHKLHFTAASDDLRKMALRKFAELDVKVVLIDATGIQDERIAREEAIGRLVEYAVSLESRRLVLDRDETTVKSDRIVIRDRLAKANYRELRYDHVRAQDDALLWIADAVAWSYAKNGAWRRNVQKLIVETINVSPTIQPRRRGRLLI